MKRRSSIPKFSLGASHGIFGVVLLLRLFVLGRLVASPFLLPSRGDMYFYNDWAQRILNGQWTDHLAFYGLPGYAYWLALLYKVFGYSPFVPGFLQALLDSGTAVLIYQIALRVLPEPAPLGAPATGLGNFFLTHQRKVTAALAALGWAFFVPAQAYSVILMPTAVFVFAFWFVVWRIVRKEDGPARRECFLLGLLIGITATAVATIFFLIPLLLATIILRPAAGEASRARHASVAGALLFLGITLGTSPCWIHNYAVARDPVFLSAHGGINFWIGNHPNANGYPSFPPGLRAGQAAMLEDSVTSAESAVGHSLKRSEVSRYWSNKAKDYVVRNPSDWLKLLLIKLRNFCSAFQYDDLSIVTTLREERVVLPGLYFGIVAALGFPGILLAWRYAPVSRWIAVAIFLHVGALLTVFITERYRLAVVPGLLIFAAAGLSFFWRSLLGGHYTRSATYLILVALSTTMTSWPQAKPSLWALDAYNSAWQALESNNLPLAEKKLALAYAYVPDNAEINFALGELRQIQGRTAQAKSFYATTLHMDPRHPRAFNNLGVLALEEQRFALAESFFRHALEVESRNAKTHFLLARSLLAQGNREAARREIDFALEIEPGRREFKELRREID